jgi:uncharacterized membrane protein YhfC
MMFVALAAVVYWRRLTVLPYRWFWIGAALWTVAIVVKFAPISVVNSAYGLIMQGFPAPLALIVGGLYGGLHSSLCEIGLTWVAVRIWPSWGRDADTAIGIGLGAGAFEAFLMGLMAAIAILVAMAGVEEAKPIRDQLDIAYQTTPLFWLVGTAERIIAILCHASSRALVLLGVVHRRPWMVFWGFAIFTVLDGIVTAAHLAGAVGTISMWWIELAILPMALISIPILRWCYAEWGAVQAPEIVAGPEPLPTN